MNYDYEELDSLCSQIDLLEYASKTFEFKKIGEHDYACHCPKHIDKTPSLTINAKDNYFYCFSCGVSGNLISWLRIFEGYSFDDAVEKVANLAGRSLSCLRTSDTILFYKKLKSYKHNDDIIVRDILDRSYYEQFSDEIPNEWVEEGIPEDTLKKYEVRVDKKSNRIVYPVYDKDFRLIGAKGRTRFKNYKQLKIMKYMNYTKIGSTDFFAGMKQAIDTVNSTKQIIIFEGIKSVMKADSWGWHNTVSSETSRLNEKQIKLIIEMGIKNVVIAYDKGVNIKDLKLGMLKRFSNVYAVVDKYGFLNDKDAPVDKGREIWERLYESRVRL